MSDIRELAEKIANIAANNSELKDGATEVTIDDEGIAYIEAELSKYLPRWISVSERLPKFGSKVIGYHPEYGQRETVFDHWSIGSIAHERHPQQGCFSWHEPQSNWASSWKPTHWKPLDAPPEPGR